jgi:hypothetical protein
MDGWRSNGAARLMNADADLAAQSLDFILQVQLATLDFQNFQIVDREMLLSLGQLGFQRFVPQFKFHKMRLDRHQEGLLVSEWPDLPRSRGWEDTGQPPESEHVRSTSTIVPRHESQVDEPSIVQRSKSVDFGIRQAH